MWVPASVQHLASRADNSELMARIASYELAFKMQQHAPEAVDFNTETAETKELYGIDGTRTDDFGRGLDPVRDERGRPPGPLVAFPLLVRASRPRGCGAGP